MGSEELLLETSVDAGVGAQGVQSPASRGYFRVHELLEGGPAKRVSVEAWMKDITVPECCLMEGR